MKKIIIYISFSFLPFFSFAQFNTSVDFVASIDYNNVSNSFFTEEQGEFNFRIGGNFNFRVFDNITMKTGLRFAQLATTIEMNDLRWPSEMGPNGWVPDPSLPRYQHISTTNRYFEIPIIGRYEFGHKRFSYYVEIGISPHLYYQTKVTNSSNLNSTSATTSVINQGDKRILMGYVMGFGINYKLSEKLQLFAQPTVRLYSANTTSIFGLSSGYRSYGLEFGIRRGLSFVQKDDN